jgi:hypothetical protein
MVPVLILQKSCVLLHYKLFPRLLCLYNQRMVISLQHSIYLLWRYYTIYISISYTNISINLSLYQSISLSIYLSINLSLYQSISLSIYQECNKRIWSPHRSYLPTPAWFSHRYLSIYLSNSLSIN